MTATPPLAAERRRTDPSPDDVRRAVGDAIRDLIRHDPALWARVQADAALWQTFGFADAATDD
jgi:hypothetical protein